MNKVFLLNETLKEELVLNCKASYAHTTWHPNGLSSIPFLVKMIGSGIIDDVPYYETYATWPLNVEEENLENAINYIEYYSKKINKIAIMTDIIEEENTKSICFSWAIFLDKISKNDLDLG
jgi:hypothetical protein